jgi:hypothetical protein
MRPPAGHGRHALIRPVNAAGPTQTEGLGGPIGLGRGCDMRWIMHMSVWYAHECDMLDVSVMSKPCRRRQ